MQATGRHWALAISGAVLVHVAVATAILWRPQESGAASAGLGGIEVSLGPAGGAPGGEARPVEEVADAETAAPQETLAEPPPPTAITASSALEIPTDSAAEAAQVVDAMPVDIVEAQAPREPVVEEAAAIEAVEQVAAAPLQMPPPPRPKARPLDQRQPVVTDNPEPVRELASQAATAPHASEKRSARVAPSAAGAGGKAGTQPSADAGSGDATTGGGLPGSSADYIALLQAWLEKHKEYPRAAQMRRQEGTALLYFVMDRDGRVIEYRVQKSSGHELLDREVREMIERAQPLPRMPEDMREARLEVVVPVQFLLR